jgi:hypothetical protein
MINQSKGAYENIWTVAQIQTGAQTRINRRVAFRGMSFRYNQHAGYTEKELRRYNLQRVVRVWDLELYLAQAEHMKEAREVIYSYEWTIEAVVG